MSKTLLTGANGFVAAHLLDQLIAAGHHVTGSVRSASKGEQIMKMHPRYEGFVEFVVVDDYAKEGVWDVIMKEGDFDYVVHSAASTLITGENTDFERDFLRVGVQGALELLKSAKKYGKNLKSIAVTGSINAMTTGEDITTRKFNSESWLPLTIADAISRQNSYYSYCVAKAETEKAIWAFMSSEKPNFTVSVLLPGLIFGPPVHFVSDLKAINYSSDVFYALFNGSNEVVPGTSFVSYIDVRDLATAHITSLTCPAVANKRFLVGGNKYSSQIAVDALKKVPELKGRLPRDGDEVVPEVVLEDVQVWNERLGLVPRSPEVTFGDAARTILELERVLGVRW